MHVSSVAGASEHSLSISFADTRTTTHLLVDLGACGSGTICPSPARFALAMGRLEKLAVSLSAAMVGALVLKVDVHGVAMGTGESFEAGAAVLVQTVALDGAMANSATVAKVEFLASEICACIVHIAVGASETRETLALSTTAETMETVATFIDNFRAILADKSIPAVACHIGQTSPKSGARVQAESGRSEQLAAITTVSGVADTASRACVVHSASSLARASMGARGAQFGARRTSVSF